MAKLLPLHNQHRFQPLTPGAIKLSFQFGEVAAARVKQLAEHMGTDVITLVRCSVALLDSLTQAHMEGAIVKAAYPNGNIRDVLTGPKLYEAFCNANR